MSTAQCISLKNTLKYELLRYFMRGGSLFFQKALGIEHNCSALPSYPLYIPYPSVGVPLSPVLAPGGAVPPAGRWRWGGYFTLKYNLAKLSDQISVDFSVQPTRDG